MKIYKPIGSKERFAEIFQGVNKVKLNEGFGQNYNPQAVLEMAYEGLKNGTLNIVHSNSQGEGEQSFIELVCKDKQGNNITFTFKTLSSAGDQEGVYNVDKTIMTNFSFDDQTGEDSVEMDENALKQFNAQHANDLFDAVKEYIDVEETEPAIDEIYEDAIRKIDSSPFGKNSFDKLQTGKAYADEKPVNPAIRVKSPELDKFVNEDDLNKEVSFEGNNNTTKVLNTVSQELKEKIILDAATVVNRGLEKQGLSRYDMPKEAYNKLIKHVGLAIFEDYSAKVNENLNEEEAKIAGDYPDPMGKKFKPKEHYPKKKRKPQTSVKLSETEEENNYEETSDSNTPIDKRAKKTAQSDIHKEFNRTVPYDTKFNAGIDEKAEEPLTGDDNVTDTEFMNKERQGLQGGEKDVPSDTTNDINPETEMGTEKDVKAGTGEDQISHQPMDNEPAGDEIEKIAQDKEEAGEMIAGGKGEGKSPLEFTSDQILKGMRVEMEHTDDPMVSLEIALDHLTEDPEYYGDEEENPQLMAQANAAADANEPENAEDDKEKTDMLLGFKPHNVGDEIETDEDVDTDDNIKWGKEMLRFHKDYNNNKTPEKPEDALSAESETPVEEKPKEVAEEAGFEEYTGNIGDRYADEDGNEFVVHDKVKGGVTLKTQSGEIEVATSDLKFYKKLNEGETIKKIITEEQIKTAKRTLSNSKVPTGMTKKEAVQILMNNNLKKIL
jgi:hypothetical protein